MWFQIVPIALVLVSTLTNGMSASSTDENEITNQKRGRYSYDFNPVDAYIRRLSMDYLRRIKFALATGGRKANKRSQISLENAWGVWGRDDSPMLSRRNENSVEASSPMLSRREVSEAVERDIAEMLLKRELSSELASSPMLSKKSLLSKRSVENVKEVHDVVAKKSSPMLSKKSAADAKN